MTDSDRINSIILAAKSEGNLIKEISTGWTKVRQVAYMSLPLTDSLRKILFDDPKIRYFSADGTPHDKAEEGFIDDVEKVAISFPR